MNEWPGETSPGRSTVIARSEATWQSRSVERRPHNRTAATTKTQRSHVDCRTGATRIDVDQDPVGSSASYLVQCRLKGESIAEDARLTTQASDAEINISGQGIQIVRPQACNAACQPVTPIDAAAPPLHTPRSSSISSAMPPSAFGIPTTPSKLTGTKRQPFASSSTASLPTTPNGKHHPSATEPGYSLSIGDLADFAGVGHPIIRVYFNCNAAAERCNSLGRYPWSLREPIIGGTQI